MILEVALNILDHIVEIAQLLHIMSLLVAQQLIFLDKLLVFLL